MSTTHFYRLAPSDDYNELIKILDATLFITLVELNAPLLLQQANAFEMKSKTHYPATNTQIITFTAKSVAQHVSVDNTFLEPIPKRIMTALIKNTAFVVSTTKNTYHFQSYYMANLVLYVNGVELPSETITMDCSSPFVGTRA